MPFKPVPPKVDFVAQEKQILQWWKETRAFQKMRELHKGQPTWSFIDGPITANNPMGVHHAWGRTYKDLFGRYRTMRGHELRYQNGFDCQGLWVEVNVEKDLGFQTKKDIENYGLAPFVILCKQRVLNFAAVQTEQSIRLGMWMDWDDPETLRRLRDKLGENPNATITITAPSGVQMTGTVEQVISQLGLVPYGGSYFTFSDKNNYDIWSFLRKCHDNGWLYKGTDVMPWCWRCGTGISQHEIITEGYIEKSDPSVTLRFPLVDRPGESLLVWTTTPWTLTSNVAAAVGPDLTYVKVKQGNEVLYLSKGTTKMLNGSFQVLDELKGAEMQGWKYAGPFDDLPATHQAGGWTEPAMRRLFAHIKETATDAHRVILWSEVGEAEGTGIVHIAPGCGEEDFALGKENHLPIIAPLDENGFYGDGFGWLSGKPVAFVTQPIIEDLKQKGILYKFETYTHRYPECWRCHTPLVFRLVDEWFISMDGIRPKMIEIANQIRWIPEFGKERELDWLHNMHDWMISKKRYWGLALPIWECEHCGHFTVIGSREELQARAVEGWEKFDGHTPHRPYIDEVKIKCDKCGEKVSRIKDVGNPWLDAGIVSLSTMGYRTQHEYWKKWFPGDLISESFPGQFRNWFYALLTMAAVLEGKPATRTIHGYETLLAEDGSEMHKSRGNMIEFNEAADKIGADVMRWMYCCQRYESDMLFGYHVADETRRRFFLPLWNVYNFFVTYANLDKWMPDEGRTTNDERSELDRWILARLQQVIEEVTMQMDEYIAYKATKCIEEFLDDLSNWYVRRSRRRFWKSEADADKHAAYATLYKVLVTLTKLLAPFIPFATEVMYQNLVRSVDAHAPESVHHCDFPRADASQVDTALLAEMDAARRVVNLGHSIRAENNLKVRQPLARAIVVADAAQRESLTHLRDLVADELNVKSVEYATREEELVTYQVRPNFQTLSPKVQKLFPDPATDDQVAKKHVRDARKSFIVSLQHIIDTLDPAYWAENQRSGKSFIAQNLTSFMRGEKGIELIGGVDFEFEPNDVLVTPQPKPGFAVKADGDYVVALDTTVTPELKAEGLAREFVRRIQDLRKSAEYDIADHIRVFYTATPTLTSAIEAHRAYIMSETLADEMRAGAAPVGAAVVEDAFDGEKVSLGIVRRDA